MPDIASIIESGTTNLWLFIPTAILLGALHGLEPGHSKTMMAAFIIAIRGTVYQAVMLGLAATVSHTAVVWAVALAGLHFGAAFNTEATEPYLQLVSAFLIIAVALWMIWRTRQDQAASSHNHHGEGPRLIDIGHGGKIAIDIFEDGVPPRWRIEPLYGAHVNACEIAMETERPDGTRHVFRFAEADGMLESTEAIPEPHEFTANLRIAHAGHAHTYTLAFHEHKHHHDAAGSPLRTSRRAKSSYSG